MRRETVMKRAGVAAFIAAIVLTAMSVAPGAQAAGAGRASSTKCALSMVLKFDGGGLVQGMYQRAFFTVKMTLVGCTGGTVTSATGKGGSIGDLKCDSGRIRGSAAAKAKLFWDTGDTSSLNFFFHFARARFDGVVVDGLFKGETVKSRNFDLTPVRGDCATSPLEKAKLTGSMSL
jgi:hypothetical protein